MPLSDWDILREHLDRYDLESTLPPRPILLLDIDGPINVAHTPGEALVGGDLNCDRVVMSSPRWYEEAVIPRGTSERLRAIGEAVQFVWCTAWEDLAAPSLCEYLGIECAIHVPFVGWQGFRHPDHNWKWPYIAKWIDEHGVTGAGRKIGWLDDDFRARDEEIASSYGIKLFRAYSGINDGHVTEILNWAGRP